MALRDLGSDPNNVWAVGDIGTIVKWNGTSWTLQNSKTTEVECRLGQRCKQCRRLAHREPS